MGQGWKIVNVDKKEALYKYDLKLGESLGNLGCFIFEFLTDLNWLPITEIMKEINIDYKKYRVPNSLGQLQLPEEIICMVFAEIDDLSDVFCLGAANTRLMILSEKRLRELMSAESWRGDRVICIAEGTKKDDLPDGISVQEYQDFLRNPPNKSDVKIHWYDGWNPTNFSDWVDLEFRTVEDSLYKEQRSLLMKNLKDADGCYRWNDSFISTRRYEDVCHMLTSKYFSVPTKPDVLWNLSKKAYVRTEVALMAFDGIGYDINEEQLIGTILHIQICWGSYDDARVLTGDLLHSKWAGDRFEFTDKAFMDRRLKKEGGEGWKDVSEEAVRVLEVVFEALNHDEDWREHLCSMPWWQR